MPHTHDVTAQPPPTAERPVLRGTGFGLLFVAAAASKSGTEVSRVALPLTAVLALHASPGVVGLLGMASTVAFLVIGLPAGVWVDRVRRRGIMVAADAARAVLLVSVPVAWWQGWLSLPQLFIVAALVGVATVFFDVSDHSYLPFLVGREGLVAANARLGGLNAVGAVAGPSVGGYLVAWLTAPAALLVESASYLWSAAFVGAIRRREPVPEPAAGSPMLGQIREGLAHVFRHPVLSRLAIAGAMGNLFQQLIIVMLPVLLVRELGLSPVLLGAFFAMGGVGGFLGASTASRIGRLVGHGRALWLVSLVPAPASLVVPLVGTGPWLWVAAAGWLLSIAKVGVDNVLGVSFRQSCTPDALLGRMNATFRFLLTGSVAVGAGIAALLGQYVAVRASLWVGGAGLALVWIPIFFSPLRHTSGEDRSPSTLR